MSQGHRLIEPRSIFEATATNHVSLRVADYALSRDFYMDLFGMTSVYDDGSTCAISFGSPSRSLFIRQAQDGEPAPVIDHLAISVAGFDAEAAGRELETYGFEPERRGEHGWAIEDPEGFPIEICAEEGVLPGGTAAEPAPDPGPAGTSSGAFQATAVNHVAYLVRNYTQTRDFYIDLFGMQVTFEDRQKCAIAYGHPEDALYLSSAGADGAVVDHLAFSIADFDLSAAEATLRDLGFDPEDDGPFAWSIWDPDGLKVQVCAELGVYPGGRRDPYHVPR
jgi:catechol 2,3-dioxygenase-like lactoylglutathione lyase family enzyme